MYRKQRRNKCTLSPPYGRSVGRFFFISQLFRRCIDDASRRRANARLGPTETRPTPKYANASHKPPQQVHFSEAREPSRAAAKIQREMHPHVRRSFVTWTPEKSDGDWPAFACGQRGFVNEQQPPLPPSLSAFLSLPFFPTLRILSSFSSTISFLFSLRNVWIKQIIQVRAFTRTRA